MSGAVAAALGLALLAATAESAGTAPPLVLTLSTPADHYAIGAPVPLTARVTNATDATCGLASHPDAALRVVSVTANGKPITPLFSHALYGGGLPSAVRASLRATRPGGSIDVTRMVRTMEAGTQRLLLIDVEPLSAGDGLVSMWPIDGPGTYQVSMRYEVPAVDAEPAVCAGSSNVASVSFTLGAAPAAAGAPAGGGVPALAIVAVAVLLTVAGLAGWLLSRRRRAGRALRERSVVTLTVIVLLAGGLTTGVPTPARADLRIPLEPPGFANEVQACLRVLRGANHTPETRRILDLAESDSTPPITVVFTDGGSNTFDTPLSPGGPGSSSVSWNPHSRDPYETGVPRDPCTALFHELVHATRYGDRSAAPVGTLCGATCIPREEVIATFIENEYRVANGLPPRTEYEGTALPAELSECDAPPPPPPPGPERICGHARSERYWENGCAESTGDPHLTTFDGVRFSPQAVGELVLVESVGGRPDLVVQVRQSPLGPSRRVSVNAAVVVRVGEARVTLTLTHGGVTVRHDGAVVATERGAFTLPGGGTIERGPSSRRWAPDGVTVKWPDGSAVRADPIGAAGLQVRVRLGAGRRGAVRGLLGDFDGNPDGDLVTRDGVRITDPKDRTQLYAQLVESWRVSDAESLFDYAPGENTATFTDRSFPDAVLTVADLDPEARERATAVCGVAGVADSVLLENCVLDVAASGLAVFATAAGDSQRDLSARRAPDGGGSTGPLLTFADGTTTVPLDGDRATIELTAPGAIGQVTFEATAGQVVYVVLGNGTLPDGCGTVRLLGPGGSSLRTGCLSRGAGALERTVLEKAGRYSVVVDPRGDVTGRLSLRVVTAVDDEQVGTLGGPPVSVTVREPGAEGRVVFDATAGQKVFVQVDPVAGSAPVPNQCGALVLRGPGGATLRSGCMDDGAGDIDALSLAEAGRYTVQVNPSAEGTGTARVRLIAVADQSGSLSPGGPAVTARIEQPGAVARLAFSGRVGQRVVVLLSKATLPDVCGAVRVLDPKGREAASGCLRDGKGQVAITLRAAGPYVVLVDPRARATGTVDVQVREE